MCNGKLFHKWVHPVKGLTYRTCTRCGRHEAYESGEGGLALGHYYQLSCKEFEERIGKAIDILGIKTYKDDDFKSSECTHFNH